MTSKVDVEWLVTPRIITRMPCSNNVTLVGSIVVKRVTIKTLYDAIAPAKSNRLLV